MRKDKDMTVGNPFKLIGTFSFSLIVGNLFQQLYTFVDTIIIGKKIGTLGLAAVGGTEWLIFLANGVVIGLVQGFVFFWETALEKEMNKSLMFIM